MNKNTQTKDEGGDYTPPTRLASSLTYMTCEFVEATELIPREWDMWFWAEISDNAPFSWGDNNRSMVCACDFKRHCEDRLLCASNYGGVPQKEIDRFLAILEELGSLYIDLEN